MAIQKGILSGARQPSSADMASWTELDWIEYISTLLGDFANSDQIKSLLLDGPVPFSELGLNDRLELLSNVVGLIKKKEAGLLGDSREEAVYTPSPTPDIGGGDVPEYSDIPTSEPPSQPDTGFNSGQAPNLNPNDPRPAFDQVIGGSGPGVLVYKAIEEFIENPANERNLSGQPPFLGGDQSSNLPVNSAGDPADLERSGGDATGIIQQELNELQDRNVTFEQDLDRADLIEDQTGVVQWGNPQSPITAGEVTEGTPIFNPVNETVNGIPMVDMSTVVTIVNDSIQNGSPISIEEAIKDLEDSGFEVSQEVADGIQSAETEEQVQGANGPTEAQKEAVDDAIRRDDPDAIEDVVKNTPRSVLLGLPRQILEDIERILIDHDRNVPEFIVEKTGSISTPDVSPDVRVGAPDGSGGVQEPGLEGPEGTPVLNPDRTIGTEKVGEPVGGGLNWPEIGGGMVDGEFLETTGGRTTSLPEDTIDLSDQVSVGGGYPTSSSSGSGNDSSGGGGKNLFGKFFDWVINPANAALTTAIWNGLVGALSPDEIDLLREAEAEKLRDLERQNKSITDTGVLDYSGGSQNSGSGGGGAVLRDYQGRPVYDDKGAVPPRRAYQGILSGARRV